MKKLIFILLPAFVAGCISEKVQWVSSTFDEPWAELPSSETDSPSDAILEIDPAATLQTMDGFGTCASEQSWASLSSIPEEDRKTIFHELFHPGAGANFTMARTPLGASDFSLGYYSYDDVGGDFALEHFSIDRDRSYLLPFLSSALAENPGLMVWASPWCPPSWMKVNKHYANTSTAPIARRFEQMRKQAGGVPEDIRAAGGSTFGFNPLDLADNGLDEANQVREGQDAFILEPEYLDAYARYFGKYVEAYKAEGIDIFMVMPQNEPNSAQWYPACTWTPDGLKKFIAVLGPEMERRGVQVWLGTIERPDVSMWDQIVNDPAAGGYIKGLGFQWAGKEALPGMHAEFPQLPCWMTEQECGNGANDWRGAMHSWDLMREYITNGCSGYFYWNTSLFEGESSAWGWRQNSLVTVNRADGTWRYTPEYYIIRHASSFVARGAKVIRLSGSFDDALAFVNPDGSIVVLAANQTERDRIVTISISGKKSRKFSLPAGSLNTFVVK